MDLRPNTRDRALKPTFFKNITRSPHFTPFPVFPFLASLRISVFSLFEDLTVCGFQTCHAWGVGGPWDAQAVGGGRLVSLGGVLEAEFPPGCSVLAS